MSIARRCSCAHVVNPRVPSSYSIIPPNWKTISLHTVEVFESTTSQSGEKGWLSSMRNDFPSLEAAQSYASRQHLPFRRITITDTHLSVVYDSITSSEKLSGVITPNPRSNMPRRPQTVSSSPTVTFAVYGTGVSSLENTTALLNDLIGGLQPCTPKFILPVGKMVYTSTVSHIRDYALDLGYEYVVVHHEQVGRTKNLKEAVEAAAEVFKVEDTATGMLDLISKARDARLLFLWGGINPDGSVDATADVEDEQRLLNETMAAGVIALDVFQGMEPVAPDDSAVDDAEQSPDAVVEQSDEEQDEPFDDQDPEYAQFITWSARRQLSFARHLGYTEQELPTGQAALIALLYPDDIPTEEPTPVVDPEPARPAREVRKAAEKDKPAAATVDPSTARSSATATRTTPEPAEAPDEAQAAHSEAIQVPEVTGHLAHAIAEILADLVVDKVIERLRARSLEASKDDVVRDLTPSRRPGRPRKEES